MLDHPLVDEINNLAKQIGELHGFTVPPGFRFYMATSPIAEFCWNVATVVVYNDIMISGREVDLPDRHELRARCRNEAMPALLH